MMVTLALYACPLQQGISTEPEPTKASKALTTEKGVGPVG